MALNQLAIVGHYGVKATEHAQAEWSATNDAGDVLFSGALSPETLALGSVTTLGDISAAREDRHGNPPEDRPSESREPR